MLRPFLLVGVGGSGGKTLRVVREDLQRRLSQAGWTGDLPAAWQFVHVDVPTHADGNDPDLPAQLPERDYQGLVAAGVDYRTIDAALLQGAGSTLRDAVATWRPDPNKVNVPASKGAGQYRTLGRIITVAGLSRINEALQRARRALSGAEVVGELAEVTRVLGGTPAASAAEPTVIVVSSIAGGSGAGAVIDVCDAIRSLSDKWADESVGLLYAPDVFDYLAPEARRGVRPNSLATLAEILNGYWNTNGPSDATTELFARNGVALGAARRSGPRYPLLVGSRNANVAYATQNDIYRALGRSVASWVASPTLQDAITGYLQGNWANTAQSVSDRLPLHSQGTETPFSAIGSARVGLGRDRFADYASEHLARSAVERLVKQHETLRRTDDDRPEKQLVRDTADDVFPGFLRQSRLHERGEENNHLIDALRPAGQTADAEALTAQILTRIKNEIPAKGEKVDNVRRAVVNAVTDRAATFASAQREARYAQARVWVAQIQDHLADLVATQVAFSGAAVTEQVLHKLVTELNFVKEELKQEAAKYRRWATDVSQPVAQALNDQNGPVVLASADALRSAVHGAVNTLLLQAEADVRDLALALIPDLIDNLLEPLTDAVRNAHEHLALERSDSDSAVASWPEGDVVPIRLRPAPNEFLLDPYDEYPAILGDLVTRSTGSADPREARRDAEIQVLLGADEIDGSGQSLVQRTVTWVPRDHLVNGSVAAVPTRAAYDVEARAGQILARSRSWLTKEGTAVGTYIAEGLRDHLNPDRSSPAELDRRLNRFSGQLVAALNAAEPLVSINPSVLVNVHGRHEPAFLSKFGEIPLPEKSRGREVVRRVLESRGRWNAEVEKAFTDGNGGFIDVFTHLSEPYEPVVFDSLMRPIASDWGAKNKAADSRAEFWRWRRSRPLSESLPLSPDVLDAMIRGWFVAGTLQQLELDNASASVFVPAGAGVGGAMKPFPSPTLRALDLLGSEGLAVVLESIVLALVDVNSQESLAPMEPYSRLVELGGGSGVAGDEEGLSVELKRWILEGANRRPDKAAPNAVGWEERRQAVLDRLVRLRTSYSNHFENVATWNEALEFPPSFDLRHQIVAALGDLHRAVETVEAAPAGDFGWA